MDTINRKHTVIKEDFDELSEYLENLGPIVLHEEPVDMSMQATEQFSEEVIIPPLNTDVRFSEQLPRHIPTKEEAEGYSHSHPHFHMKESFSDEPLNTDIRFTKNYSYDPREHNHPSDKHPNDLHTHEHTHDNFSWAIPSSDDSPLDLVKKSLIHTMSTQHACGSCWEM